MMTIAQTSSPAIKRSQAAETRRSRRGSLKNQSYQITFAVIYRVILKKVSFCIFTIILISKEEKNYYRKQTQRAISDQVCIIFGHCLNHQNKTFERPYKTNHDSKIVFTNK